MSGYLDRIKQIVLVWWYTILVGRGKLRADQLVVKQLKLLANGGYAFYLYRKGETIPLYIKDFQSASALIKAMEDCIVAMQQPEGYLPAPWFNQTWERSDLNLNDLLVTRNGSLIKITEFHEVFVPLLEQFFQAYHVLDKDLAHSKYLVNRLKPFIEDLLKIAEALRRAAVA